MKHLYEALNVKDLKHKLPARYHAAVSSIVQEDDLIDDCRYMLYLNDGYLIMEEFSAIPVKSIKEAITFLKTLKRVSKS